MQKIEATSIAIALADWFISQAPDHPATATLEEVRDHFAVELSQLRKQRYNQKHRAKNEEEA